MKQKSFFNFIDHLLRFVSSLSACPNGIQVLKQEPLIPHPRVMATGHYAWYSDASMLSLKKRAAGNMAALLGG